MAEISTVSSVSSETASNQTSTDADSAQPSSERSHCRGPLDGSLYARVNKNKKAENELEANLVTEATPEKELPNHVPDLQKSTANHTPNKNDFAKNNSPNSRVVVLNGNRIIYKPQYDLGFDPQKISAPLANLSEFNGSYLSLSSGDSLRTPSSVTKVSLTSSQQDTRETKSGVMADGSIQQTAARIVDDVIKKSTISSSDGTKPNARFSEISSCSATTLSSTSTEDGGPHLELSDHDSSDSSDTDEKLRTLEGNISPGTVKGSVSPEILFEQAIGESPETNFFDKQSPAEFEVKVSQGSAPTEDPPPAPPQAVPTTSRIQGVMYNGGVVHGSYNKGPEYAVPMRDMKITTIPSKRAVLVSTGSDNDNMASPSSDRRDSIYDEGNAYNASGYATIEEYDGGQHVETRSGQEEEHSYIPEDVQELLNGLQEGPTSSDIDSGFHGSSMALQSQSKSPTEHNNVTSQSSSDFSDPFGSPPPSQSNEQSPVYDGSYPMGKISPREVSPNPVLPVKANYNATKVLPPAETESQAFCNVGVAPAIIPKKNLNPGIPIPTQTMPEPQPAKVQIITMRNVYTNEQGVPLNPVKPESPKLDRTKVSNTLQTQPSAFQQEPSKVVEKPPLPPHANSMETVTMRTQHAPMETTFMQTSPDPVVMRNKNIPVNHVAMENDDAALDPYLDVEDQLDTENIRSVEEQIMHAQKHIEFLKEQQEKLVKRKQDRSRCREILKRNSSAFDRQSQGYPISPGISATLPRQPYTPADDKRDEIQKPPSQETERKPETEPTAKPAISPQTKSMPPITNVNQRGAVHSPVQPQPQSVWNAAGPKLTRQASDASHDRSGPAQPTLPVKTIPRPAPKQDKDDIIMSSDLQEQLAELDRCIAELTTSMDVPVTPDNSAPESEVVRRRQSYTLEIERKMDPNVPLQDSNASSVPHPPARSRASFDSYKRLSQDFDIKMKRNSFTEQAGNDDVFSPGPQGQRKKKPSQFPPQTSVTRRQHTAPAPPPKRRMSLEERLSPGLMQALTQNPGAKPKEDIHSYKEDLAPDNLPDTPTFPLSPATPYVNTDSPARSKSPPGLAKTPLSMLHLKPKEKPMESLHHVESPENKKEEPQTKASPVEDTVDGRMMALQANGQQTPMPVPEQPVQATVAMQNGHTRETALLSDGGEQKPEPQQPTPQHIQVSQNAPVQQKPPQYINGQNHIGCPAESPVLPAQILPVQQPAEIQPHQVTPPSYLHLTQSNVPSENLHSTPQTITMEQFKQQQQAMYPQQYLNHSGASHSSHSPVATSSSHRGSSDSLDNPSTRHSNSSILSSSSSSSAHHPGMPMSQGAVMPPNNVMRPGSQMSNYERHLLPPNASGARSGDESLGSPQSGRTSSSSISDIEKMNYDVSHATVSAAPKFIRDTTAYWYKPDITREQALAILRNKPAGSFIVRDSRCFPGAFGLALKVDKLPPNVQLKPGADLANEFVRHFLIEPSTRGVKLKGCPNEPVFGSLSALVYQHSITALALPCKLIIPTMDQEIPQPVTTPQAPRPEPTPTTPAATTAAGLLKQGAACNVIYIGSVDTESLTGPPAIERAISESYQAAKSNPNLTSIVHFKVSPQGITLTDNARKLFFRRHYPTDTVTFCGLDPMGGANKGPNPRRWDATAMRGGPDAWIFGFVARKQAGSRDNQCHVFAELDSAQPARAIVNFVMKVLIGYSRQNSS